MSEANQSEPSAREPVGRRLAELDEIELTIDRLVSGGEGLGRFEGIPIFVPRSAPGDRLRVQLTERRPHYGRARILDVLEPGEGRREPPCSHYSQCGGCDLQHIEDDLQSKFKAAAMFLELRALAHLRSGENDAALEDLRLSFRLIGSIRSEPILISHLVRLAMLHSTLQPIWEGLGDRAWTEQQLAEIELGRDLGVLVDHLDPLIA